MTREKTDELYINCSNHMCSKEGEEPEPLVEENLELLEKIRRLLGIL